MRGVSVPWRAVGWIEAVSWWKCRHSVLHCGISFLGTRVRGSPDITLFWGKGFFVRFNDAVCMGPSSCSWSCQLSV